MSIDTLLGLTGVIISIIGLITGYLFYRKSQRIKEPYVAWNSLNLIDNFVSKLEGLEIFYKKYRVESLTISTLTFWNHGADTITRHDIAIANPIRIKGKQETKILAVDIISTTNEANQISCSLNEDKTEVSIDFEYIDKDEGAIFRLIHTGLDNSALSVTGSIKGVHVIRSKEPFVGYTPLFPFLSHSMPNIVRRRNLIFTLVSGSIAIFMGLYLFIAIVITRDVTLRTPPTLSENPEYIPTPYIMAIFIGAVLPIVMCMFGFLMLAIAKHIWQNKIPRSLDPLDQ